MKQLEEWRAYLAVAQHAPYRALPLVVQLVAARVGEIEDIDHAPLHGGDARRQDTGAGHSEGGGQITKESGSVGAAHLAHGVPGRRVIVEVELRVGNSTRSKRCMQQMA